ncbi:MAG: prepilin-type N-terminal cleavage/methylation domain-containing protein [Planctomycetales bacterium]|nr:prepilin-type N-terminal cleavage/methylation domain-containing protein [Planctomycetales bacterium]
MNRLPSGKAAHARRRAMTLPELLIVVLIITVMMALVAASIRPALENRKSKEASRLLNSMFAQAKAHAMATGRRVGVWLQGADPVRWDRTVSPITLAEGDVNYNYATEIYLAEELPPYAGDYENEPAAGVLQSHALVDGDPSNRGRCWIYKPENSLFVTESGEIQPGDRIKFNYRGPEFTITGLAPAPTAPGNLAKFNAPATFVEVVFDLAGYPMPLGANATGRADLVDGSWFNSLPMRVSYQVIRQPRRIGQATSLPNGTCVDLRNSGIQRVHEDIDGSGTLDPGEDYNQDGFLDLVPWASPMDSGTPDILSSYDPLPGADFGLRATESGHATVVVVFSPDGSVSTVTRNREHYDRLATATTWFRGTEVPAGTIHFLVGTLDKMIIASQMPYIAGASGANELVNINENLMSSASLWVSVNARTGNVTSAQNDWQPGGSFAQSLLLSRRFANESQNGGAR